MNLSILLLSASSVFYCAAFFLYAGAVFGRAGRRGAGAAAVRSGFLFGTLYLASEALRQGVFVPVSGLSAALAFFSWSIAFVYFVVLSKSGESFGIVLSPMLALLTAAACALSGLEPRPLPASLNSYFAAHIVCAFFAYAGFAVGFSASLLYLARHRALKKKTAGPVYHNLPSLEELDGLVYHPLVWGTGLLGLAMLLGAGWAKSAFGDYWARDPKTVASGFTMLAYGTVLCLRYGMNLRGRRIVLASAAAFAVMAAGFIVPRFFGGQHSF